MGGTSTDLGVLVNGFPASRPQGVDIGGVRTNFRMPDVWPDRARRRHGGLRHPGVTSASGRDSVGYRIQQDALIFGGQTPTLTDGAVLAGRADIAGAPGGADRACRYRWLLAEALGPADVMLAEAIDRVKTSEEVRPLIAVGGGSILVPDRIPGVSEIVRPEHFDVANAVGAAIASVSGQVGPDRLPGPDGRQAVLDEARDEARERAVAAGADPGTRADHRGGRDPARLPHLSRGPDPGQGGRHPGRRAG